MLLPSGENLSATVEAHDLPVDERSAEVAPRRPFQFARARTRCCFLKRECSARPKPVRRSPRLRRNQSRREAVPRRRTPNGPVVLLVVWGFSTSAQEIHFSPEEDLTAIDAGLIAQAKHSIDFAFLRLDGGCDRTSPKRRGSAVHQPDICALAIEVGLFDAHSGLGRRNERRAFTLTFTKS